MKIKEILEAIKQGKTLAGIGKDIGVGKEKLSKALRNAGYEFNRKDGWFFSEEGEQPLNKNYKEFIRGVKRANVSAKRNNVKKEQNDKTFKSNINKKVSKNEISQAKEQVAPTIEQMNINTTVVRKRASFDLDVELLKKLKIEAVIQEKNLYEMVETAIRTYLKGLK
ncbi:hypothetical protein [Priestia megaterium]|uniref:hypothetical protein n=1 Tax=Priestia megaterium TaxID=1404 RepID=UPI00399F6EB8